MAAGISTTYPIATMAEVIGLAGKGDVVQLFHLTSPPTDTHAVTLFDAANLFVAAVHANGFDSRLRLNVSEPDFSSVRSIPSIYVALAHIWEVGVRLCCTTKGPRQSRAFPYAWRG
ncbi:hypothetical protein Tco_0815620 [Tanacetum coccineum]